VNIAHLPACIFQCLSTLKALILPPHEIGGGDDRRQILRARGQDLEETQLLIVHELSGFWSTHARLKDEYEKGIAPR
jgi:hypothetical protein